MAITYLSGERIQGSSEADIPLGDGLKAYWHLDESSGTTLSAANYRRGKYTLTTHSVVSSTANSATFTVQNNTVTADDIVIMTCTSDSKIEVHAFNGSSSGWDFFFVNRGSAPLVTDSALALNFIVIQ